MLPLHGDYQLQQRRRRCCGGWNTYIVVAFHRLVRTIQFLSVFLTSALINTAPETLAGVETLVLFVAYFFLMPNAIGRKIKSYDDYTYKFTANTEDLLAIAVIRAVVVIATHRILPPSTYEWHYVMVSIALASTSIFSTVKLIAMSQTKGWHRHRYRLAAVVLCALSIVFSLAHVLAAQAVMAYMKRRRRMGLLTDVGEEVGVEEATEGGHEHHPLLADEERGVDTERDDDSKFYINADGLRIHYKVVVGVEGETATQQLTPSVTPTAFVLIHGFGGGVHSWRHMMGELSSTTNTTVIAYDRPGFGLSSRPLPGTNHSNAAAPPPAFYSIEYQANIAIELLHHHYAAQNASECFHPASVVQVPVIFVGVGDGALIAMSAATCAMRTNTSTSTSTSTGLLQGLGLELEAVYEDEEEDCGEGSAAPYNRRPLSSPAPAPAVAAATGSGSGQSWTDLPNSASLGFMGSLAPAHGRREILRKLLRGELLSPPTASGGGSEGNNNNNNNGASALREETEDDMHVLTLENSTATAADATPPPPPPLFEANTTTPANPPRHRYRYTVQGVALIHPDLSFHIGPGHIRVLSNTGSTLGRQVLRDMLANEVGDIGDPRAWSSHNILPPQPTVDLYKRKLQGMRGWDAALVAVCASAAQERRRYKFDHKGKIPVEFLDQFCCIGSGNSSGSRSSKAQAKVPLLVVIGSEEGVVRTHAAKAMIERVPRGELEVLQGDGRVSFEEHPQALVAILCRFCLSVVVSW